MAEKVMAIFVLFFYCCCCMGLASSSSNYHRHGPHHHHHHYHHHHRHYCVLHGSHQVCRVGGAVGWTVRTGTNFTNWASSQSFREGDTIVFTYNKRYHNVVELADSVAYHSCNSSSPLATYTSGHDSIRLKNKGHRYFIDSHHCRHGQKMNIKIQPYDLHHSTSKSNSSGPTLIAVIIVSALLIVIGSV